MCRLKNMEKIKYDLAVAYRIYPKISGEPPIFSNNKYKLAEFCLKSFKYSLGNLKVKIWALLDNCPKEYEALFKKYFKEEDLEIIKLNGIGNLASFNLQLELLVKQNNSELVFFAEDDYYYLSNQFKKMILFLKRFPDVDFLTPYDHLDQYNFSFHNYKSYIRPFAGKHWRTIHSTCCTFLTTKKKLEKTKKVFQVYTKKTILLSAWVSLTKYKVFNPFFISKFLLNKRFIPYFYYKAWRYCWKQIIFGRKWNLWCPIPTIATHMEKSFLSPAINWKEIFNERINRAL